MPRLTTVLVLAAVACLAVLTACPAQQAVPLAFKFAAGDVNQYDVMIAGSATINAMGRSVTPMTVQGTISLIQTVTQVLPDGSGRLETRIPSGNLALTLDKDQVRFSYADGQFRWFANGKESVMPAQADLAKVPLLGTPVICTMAPNGLIREVALADPKLLGEMAKMLPGALDLTSMRSGGEPVFPDEPVKVGDTWKKTVQVSPLGPSNPVTVSISRTLDSYNDAGGIGLAKIVGLTETRYGGGPGFAVPGKDVSVAISDIRHTISSTEFFNTTSGRLMRADYDVVFSTRVSAKAAGEEKGASIDARLRVTVQGR